MNHRDTWADDLALARDAAIAAGCEVMKYFRRPTEVRYKSDEQPVTDADLAANRILKDRLLGARPDDGWLSEETADSADRLGSGRVWIVDPIDGTNSFIEGIPDFAVSVALVESGRVVLGVIHNPARDEIYEAAVGRGATRNGARIRTADRPGPGEQWALLGSRTEIARGTLEIFGPPWQVIPMGSTAYRMVKVADGTGHAYASRGSKYEWDVCAAEIIVREAGGVVTSGDGRQIVYNRPKPEVVGLISACSPELPPPLAGIIAAADRTRTPE